MPIDVQAIIDRGWRQGSLFTVEASQALLGDRRTHDASRLILASQDCDIVHRNNGEPFVDTFETKPIVRLSPTESKARNARQLHVPVSIDGVPRPHQILFWSRLALPRERLEHYAPDQHARLDPGSQKWFQQWLGSRYDRPVLPDAFNHRLQQRDARRAIREILGPCEHCFDDLYLQIDPSDEELAGDVPYTVRVALIMSELDAGREEIVTPALAGRDTLEGFLRTCPALDIQAVEIITDTDFTLADLDTYRRWDYTDLSLPNAQ